MSKSNRIYKIFMTTMIVAIAGMLLAMGIIAAQKTMKLGVQFSSNPNYKLAIAINTAENVIFQNFDTVIMDNGISSLNGNVLVADDEVFKDYGNDFIIIIKNFTTTTGIEVSMTSTAKIDGGADGIPAQIETEDNTASKYSSGDPDSVSFRIYVNSVFPQETTLSINIAEHSLLAVSYNLSNCNSTETATEWQPNTAYTTKLTVTNEDDLTLPESITVNIGDTNYEVPKNGSVEGITYDVTLDKTNYIFTGTLSIPGTLTTGDISLEGEGYIDYWGGVDATPTTLTTAGGGGSEADPYLIANGKQLGSVAKYVNNGNLTSGEFHLKLIKNIYLNNETVTKNSAETAHAWEGFFTSSSNFPLTFYFDGNNKIISGMFGSGLFKYCNLATGNISNLTIINSYISSGGAVISSSNIGSHELSNITVGEKNKPNSVVVEGSSAGGLVGASSNLDKHLFTQCTNYATVVGASYAGGILGYFYDADGVVQLFHSCINDGDVSVSSGSSVGGLLGYARCLEPGDKTDFYDNECKSTGVPTSFVGVLSLFD